MNTQNTTFAFTDTTDLERVSDEVANAILANCTTRFKVAGSVPRAECNYEETIEVLHQFSKSNI